MFEELCWVVDFHFVFFVFTFNYHCDKRCLKSANGRRCEAPPGESEPASSELQAKIDGEHVCLVVAIVACEENGAR